MATWIDPDFEDALASFALIALGSVRAATPAGATVQLLRVFAGDEPAGTQVQIDRAAVIGHGHAASTLPVGQQLTFFVDRVGPPGSQHYRARTDTYWAFAGDPPYVNMPLRDPFTRGYLKFDDLAELVPLVRDRTKSPVAFLDRLVASVRRTPVAATQPVEVHEQVATLEILSILGTEKHTAAPIALLGSPHYHVRWAAVRALARCGGPSVRPALLELLGREQVPPVQAALVAALERHAIADDRATLAAAVPRMFGQELLLSQNIMNPVMNSLPAPKKSLEALVARL